MSLHALPGNKAFSVASSCGLLVQASPSKLKHRLELGAPVVQAVLKIVSSDIIAATDSLQPKSFYKKNYEAIHRNSSVSPPSLQHPFLLWPPSQLEVFSGHSRLSCTTGIAFAILNSVMASISSFASSQTLMIGLRICQRRSRPILRMSLSHSHPLDVRCLASEAFGGPGTNSALKSLYSTCEGKTFYTSNRWWISCEFVCTTAWFLDLRQVSNKDLEAGAALGFGAASVGEEKVSAVQPCLAVPNQLWWEGLQSWQLQYKLLQAQICASWDSYSAELVARQHSRTAKAPAKPPTSHFGIAKGRICLTKQFKQLMELWWAVCVCRRKDWSPSCEIMWNLCLTTCRTWGHLNPGIPATSTPPGPKPLGCLEPCTKRKWLSLCLLCLCASLSVWKSVWSVYGCKVKGTNSLRATGYSCYTMVVKRTDWLDSMVPPGSCAGDCGVEQIPAPEALSTPKMMLFTWQFHVGSVEYLKKWGKNFQSWSGVSLPKLSIPWQQFWLSYRI